MILDMAVRRVMGTASWVRAIGDEKGGYLVRYYQRFGDKDMCVCVCMCLCVCAYIFRNFNPTQYFHGTKISLNLNDSRQTYDIYHTQ